MNLALGWLFFINVKQVNQPMVLGIKKVTLPVLSCMLQKEVKFVDCHHAEQLLNLLNLKDIVASVCMCEVCLKGMATVLWFFSY